MAPQENNQLFQAIRAFVWDARERVFRTANSALLESYWQNGQLIVEEEQNGKLRAEYGKEVLKTLAFQLTLEFGKGLDERNLNNMRAFYKAFPIWNALRTELSWTH